MSSDTRQKDIDNNSDIAAFSYFLILSWVILYTRKDSPFIQFHAKQASVLFGIFIIIMVLPAPLYRLNVLTAALAITGIFQANQGKWWKVPFVSQLVDAGISADTLWNLCMRGWNLLRRSFLAEDKQAAKAPASAAGDDRLEQVVGQQMEQIAFLEEQLLIEKYLHKSPVGEQDKKYQSAIAESKKTLLSKLPGKYTADEAESHISFRKKGAPSVYLGGFTEKFCVLFVAAPLTKPDISFGRFAGISFDPTDEKAAQKAITTVSDAVKQL